MSSEQNTPAPDAATRPSGADCGVVTKWLGDDFDPYFCGLPAVWRFAAMGSGFMHLCEEHGQRHARTSEWWSGEEWVLPPAERGA